MFATYYKIEGDTIEQLQENIFYCGVIHVERLRKYRFNHNAPQSFFACENIIFEIPSQFDHRGEELFSWPHYLLKILYTKVGIMLGKFWKGEKDVSRHGINVPEPPCHFLSIRSAVKSRDPRLLNKSTFLLPELLNSKDMGQDVHGYILDNRCDPSFEESMRSHNYYLRLKKWVQGEDKDGLN